MLARCREGSLPSGEAAARSCARRPGAGRDVARDAAEARGAMTGNELLSLLAAADPARGVALPGPDVGEASDLRERILSAPTRSRGRRRAAQPWLVGAIVAAAVGAVILARALDGHAP